mgnify:CR=1 FL=1
MLVLMKYAQKLTKIGNSIGVIIPSRVLEMLKIGPGTQVFIELIQDKLLIEKENSSNISPEFMKVVESLAGRYKDAFEELSNK